MLCKAQEFQDRVKESRLDLWDLINDLRDEGSTIYGIGAPSRAVTMIHYLGFDESMIQAIYENPSSAKCGHYIPGTKIPVLPEPKSLSGIDYLFLFSWHIADHLIPKLREKGFTGQFIIPLPEPHLV